MAVLTISREFGSGGREIGTLAAEALGYRYEDRATILAALAAVDPRWGRWGGEYDEHRPSVWERFDWSFRGYAALMQRHLLEVAAADRAVIVGRGANFLLEGVPTALRVRVTAPLAARVDRIARRDQVSREAARRLVETTDRERAGFIKALYGRRWDEPGSYDRSYDTGTLDPAAILADIRRHVAHRDAADREAASRILGLRLAAARVRAALFSDERIQLPTLQVLEEGGGLLVRGVVHTPQERRRVTETAGVPAGDTPLRFDLRYR